MVDRTTRCPEAALLVSTAAADVARAFIITWVARFGVPSDISSDLGPQFTPGLWNTMAESLGTKLHRTTAYHLRANRLCKRFPVLWKPLSTPASRTVTGSTAFHGSCWGFGPPLRKTYKLHLPSWFMASHWGSLGTLSLTLQFLGQWHNNKLRSWTMPRFSHQFPHRKTASLVLISLSNFILRDMCSFVRMLIAGPFNVPMMVHFVSLRLGPKLLSWTLAVHQNMYRWTGWNLPTWT